MIVELLYPQSANFYTVRSDHIRDAGISALIAIGTMGIALYMFKKEYELDREHLRATITQLEIEKEKAQSADKAKSDFLATISHEMRTPLNGIVGISQLLKETTLNKEQESLVSSLSYSSELLHNLISDILDVSLIESGKLAIQISDIEIDKEMEKLVEIVKPRLAKKDDKVELIVKQDEKIPDLLQGDRLRFRQVLLNLINNAIKFTDSGMIEVSSELISRSDETVLVKLTVKDTGRGISEEGQEKLFSKFFKGSGDSNIEGTGLGLSICKNLVTLMGGEIGFQSEEGIGSVFFFEIPLHFTASKNKQVLNKELKEKPLQDVRILVAEDVRINQIVIKKLMQSLGLQYIEIAEHGEEAVEKAKASWYDVILMDIQMPVMDGLEASALITSHYNNGKKPVILAITANALMADQEEYTQAGIDGFVNKPITKESLQETLSKFI